MKQIKIKTNATMKNKPHNNKQIKHEIKPEINNNTQ